MLKATFEVAAAAASALLVLLIMGVAGVGSGVVKWLVAGGAFVVFLGAAVWAGRRLDKPSETRRSDEVASGNRAREGEFGNIILRQDPAAKGVRVASRNKVKGKLKTGDIHIGKTPPQS